MNKKQGNYYRMFLTTQNYLEDQLPVFQAIPKIKAYKDELDALLVCISEVEQTHGTIALTKRKRQLKYAIAMKLSILSGALQAFAFESEDMDLVKSVKITKSELKKMKDLEIDAKVNAILRLAKQFLAELSDFGITESMLIEISNLLIDFNALIGKSRVFMINKYVALHSLEQLFVDVNSLLINKLDKLMLRFKEANTGFYEGYERNRVIVDR